jgi:hypothetical protein
MLKAVRPAPAKAIKPITATINPTFGLLSSIAVASSASAAAGTVSSVISVVS